jgi:signal transduction histidine kinase
MNLRSKTLVSFFIAALLFLTVKAQAEKTPDELAKESEAAATASASTKATPQMIMDKVNQACALLEKEGKGGFAKFKGADSEFIFAGTYIWVHDMQGVMRVHPIKFKMEGQRLIDLKDTNGKRFFTMMNNVATEKGAGWVDYLWPKPGEKEPSLKVSYVKKCKVEGEELIIGCGVYDISAEEAAKLTQQ